MTESPNQSKNTLVVFFKTILDNLRKNLSPVDFSDLLENYKTEQREEGAKAAGTASTPGQVPSDGGDCHATD